MSKLPAYATPDADGFLDYPHLLGCFGASNVLHIAEAKGTCYPLCGAMSTMPYNLVEFSSIRRPVCAKCRAAVEAGQ